MYSIFVLTQLLSDLHEIIHNHSFTLNVCFLTYAKQLTTPLIVHTYISLTLEQKLYAYRIRIQVIITVENRVLIRVHNNTTIKIEKKILKES